LTAYTIDSTLKEMARSTSAMRFAPA
jgi:hypothetical protein